MTKDKKQKIFKLVLALSILGAFIIMFAPFLVPIVLAGIFSFAFEPIVTKLTAKRPVYRKPLIVGILTVLILFILTPILMAIYKIYFYVQEITKVGFQNTPVYANLIQLKQQATAYINNMLASLNLTESFDLQTLTGNVFSQVGNLGAGFSATLVTQVPEFILATFIFCVSVYYFLSQSTQIKSIALQTNLLKKKDLEHLVGLLQTSSYNTLVSTFVIGVIQASIVSLASVAVGIGDFAVVFVVTFFCSFIPVIGAGPVAFVLAIVAFSSNEGGHGIVLLIVSVVAGTIDNILRPFLVSSSEGDIHPLVALVAIIGAIIIFGFPGLLLGPVILGVAIKMIPVLFTDPQLEVKVMETDALKDEKN